MVFNNKEFEILDDYLRSVGQFLTLPRKIILETFLKVDGHVSVKDLCKEVKKKRFPGFTSNCIQNYEAFG